ncbi:MAG TPA: amidohydrolase family protein, partial [Thermoanaerobaculia bacterium]
MRRRRPHALAALSWTVAALAAAAVSLAAPVPKAADRPLLLAGARVLDPSGERLQDGVAVLIADGRIARIAPEATIAPPAGTERLDASGLTLIPGLIDLHSHLLLHPYDETPWDEQVLKEPIELRTIRAVVAARTTVEAGFTTLRELGTEGAGFADVA